MAKKKKPQIDPRQKELHDLIEMKKMKQAAAEHRDMPVIEQDEKIIPKTFKEKWKNYWYHYKGATWGTVLGVIMLTWFIKDVFFAPRYDLTVNISTRYMLAAINTTLDETLRAYAKDYNGDKKLMVASSEMMLSPVTVDEKGNTKIEGDAQMQFANQQKLMAVLAAGDDLIFILDQNTYEGTFFGEEESIFVNLSELYPDIDVIQEDKLVLKNTELGKKMKLTSLPEEVFLCVRNIGGSAGNDEKAQKKLDDALDFVNNVLVESYPELEKK